MANLVSYFRVSTQKQGASGLGLEAQRATVADYAKRAGGTIVAEYTEVESGKKNSRVQLAEAIAAAKRIGATLVIAKLDRLARNAAFIFALRDAGVSFVACDIPEANTLTVGIFAVMAQHEAELISTRTKAALKAKKQRGDKLGTPANLTAEARAKGRQAHSRNAANNQNTVTARGYAQLLRTGGATLRAMAQTLNGEGFRTPKGGQFSAVQVMRLLS
ncbi:MAG: recombinase family protein [Pirellula sp.]|jgi:DNA invertase Pin-like site-specific DNA recombinase